MEKKLLESYETERQNWLKGNEENETTKQCETCGLVGYTEKENRGAGTPRKIIFYEGRSGYPGGCQNGRACNKDKTILLRSLEIIIESDKEQN